MYNCSLFFLWIGLIGLIGSYGSYGNNGSLVSLRSLRSLRRLRIIPEFPTLSTLPKFIKLFHFPIIISIGRARYFRNPQSVVSAIFASALPRTHPPPRRGLGGGSDLQLPPQEAGVERLSRVVRSFHLTTKNNSEKKNLLAIILLRRKTLTAANLREPA